MLHLNLSEEELGIKLKQTQAIIVLIGHNVLFLIIIWWTMRQWTSVVYIDITIEEGYNIIG